MGSTEIHAEDMDFLPDESGGSVQDKQIAANAASESASSAAPGGDKSGAAAVCLRATEQARLTLNRIIDDSSLSLRQAFQQICEIAADTLEVERVSIWLMSEDRSRLCCVNLFERSRREHSAGAVLNVVDYPVYFAAISERGVLPCELVQSDPRAIELRDSYLVPLGITSMLDAPIRRAGVVIGVVCHEHVGPTREWSTEDKDFAMSVADVVAGRLRIAANRLHFDNMMGLGAELLPEGDRYTLVGRLVVGVAHDFRNYLTVILGNAALIARRHDLPADILERAEQILETGERASQLIRDLQEFGQEPAGHPRLVSVSQTLQRFLPLLQTGTGRLYQITVTAAPEPDYVWIDPAHLERVVLNLVVNAREAMPRGGLITLRVSVVPIQEVGVLPGQYVCLEVQDTGEGIAPEHLKRIFEPHFTTKLNGPGRGLGMAIVRRLVERAGGFIRVTSGVEQGSLFQIFLPRVSGSAAQQTPHSDAADPAGE
jgi:signal transduction histidine kinase